MRLVVARDYGITHSWPLAGKRPLPSLPVVSAKSYSSQVPSVALNHLLINRLSHGGRPLLLKRVHQPIECLDEFLNAFVLESLGGRVQINSHFA